MLEAVFAGTLIPLLFLLLILRHSRPIMSVFCWGLVAFMISYHVNGWAAGILGLAEDPRRVSVFVAPVVEEAFKMLPLLYFLFAAPKSFVPYIYIFGMAIGIGFSIEENLLFVLRSGEALESQRVYVILRSVSTCLMHGMTTAIIAYACTTVRRRGYILLALVLISYGGAVFIHGLFNHLILSNMRTLAILLPGTVYIGGVLVLKWNEQKQRRQPHDRETLATWSTPKPPDA